MNGLIHWIFMLVNILFIVTKVDKKSLWITYDGASNLDKRLLRNVLFAYQM
jgi:hypothetical protein